LGSRCGHSGEGALSAAAEFGCCEHRGYELAGQFVSTDYTSERMAHAIYDKLEKEVVAILARECPREEWNGL
jgi:hypothetical protein